MNRFTLSVVSAGMLLLVAISGAKPAFSATGDAARKETQLLEDKGILPELDRSASIAGPDTNNDGLRDDVAAHIESQYVEPEQVKAARQLAKSMQQVMLVNKSDNSNLLEVGSNFSQAIDCIQRKFPLTGKDRPHRVINDLQFITANTRARGEAYMASLEALKGKTGALPNGETCD